MDKKDVENNQNEHAEESSGVQPENDLNNHRVIEEPDIQGNICVVPSTSSVSAYPKVVEFYRHVPLSKSLSSAFSNQQMKFEDLYMDDIDDLDEDLEREAVRMKYESILRPVHSCSCIQDLYRSRSLASTESNDSWTRFAQWLSAFEQPEFYNEACEFCKIYTPTPNRSLDLKFAEAEETLSQYPHYWKHLTGKYGTTIRSDIYIKETIRKNMVINSCKRILQEELRYSSERHRRLFGENTRIKFDGKMTNLNSDFKTACIYMREEYPMLLVNLIKKLEFTKFDLEKKNVEENKQRIIELAKQSTEKMDELEKRYKDKDEQGMSSGKPDNETSDK